MEPLEISWYCDWATVWTAKEPGFDSQQEQLFPSPQRSYLGSTQPPINLCSGGSFPNGKVAGAWTWSLPSYMREFIPPLHNTCSWLGDGVTTRKIVTLLFAELAGESWIIALPSPRWTILYMYILLFHFVRPTLHTALTPRLAGFNFLCPTGRTVRWKIKPRPSLLSLWWLG